MIRLTYRTGGVLRTGTVARRSGDGRWVMESGDVVWLEDIDRSTDPFDLATAERLPVQRMPVMVSIRQPWS